MNKLIAITLVFFALSGCATDDYARYATMQENVAKASADARIAEANAIAEIGKSGSEAAKVAAVLSIRGGSAQPSQPNIQAPKSFSDQLLGWVGILAPTLVQGYSIHSQTQLGMRQSDNGVAATTSTNNTFSAIAGKIQAPVTVMPQANVTTTNTTASNGSVVGGGSANTLSGTGTTGSGSYTTNANPVTTTDNHSNQNNPITTNPITGK